MIKKINFNTVEVMQHLPHRYPFMLIDKVIDVIPEVSGTGIKCVTMNEPFFQGHFPGNPVMPGVLMLEAMAQTCIMVCLPFLEDKNKLFVFSGIDKVKFRRQVLPGDTLKIDINITAKKGPLTKCQGTITVDGEVAVEAQLSAFMVPKQ
jgi:3-hydroxyacyl-[acyl-carrier-protein] dehydratase